MITAFCIGLTAAFVTGLVSDSAWRRLPATLAAVLGVAAVTASISIAAQLHLDLAGLGVPALVVGLTLGGNAAHGPAAGCFIRCPAPHINRVA